MAGLPFKRTAFIGFLPKSPGHIEKELKLYKDFNGAVVFFANQRHIKKILELINKIFGNVDVIIGREMTKINEEYIR